MSDVNEVIDNTLPPEEPAPEEIVVSAEPVEEVKEKRFDVEDLSIAETLGRLIVRPGRTLRALGDVSDRAATELAEERREARSRRRKQKQDSDDTSLEELLNPAARWVRRTPKVPRPTPPENLAGEPATFNPAGPVSEAAAVATLRRDYILIPRGEPLQFDFSPPIIRVRSLILTAIMLVFWFVGIAGGVSMLAKARNRVNEDMMPGLLMLLIGGLGFGLAMAFNYSTLRLPRLDMTRKPTADEDEGYSWFERNGLRVILFGASFLLMIGAYSLNARNQFNQLGVMVWIGSIIGFILAFAPGVGRPVEMIEQFGRFVQSIPSLVVAIRITPTFIAMVVILFAGFYFRFNDLEAYPPDMTSDHVEKRGTPI